MQEQIVLDVDSGGVTHDASILADYAVARNDHRNWIIRTSSAYRSRDLSCFSKLSFRNAERYVLIACRASERDRVKRIPYLLLERCSLAESYIDIEGCPVAVKVFPELNICLGELFRQELQLFIFKIISSVIIAAQSAVSVKKSQASRNIKGKLILDLLAVVEELD